MEKKKSPFELRRLPMDFGRFCCMVARVFLPMRKLHVSGKPYRGAPKGAAVLVSNHVGKLDPLLIDIFFWSRRVFFLASETVMSHRVTGWLLKGMGCIKIDRYHADLEAIRTSVELLRQGHLLGIFPQGSIQEGIGEVKSGMALIALRADVPIIPMYTEKRAHWYSRRTLVIGDSIDCRAFCGGKLPSLADMERLSDEVTRRMLLCRETFEQRKDGKNGKQNGGTSGGADAVCAGGKH